MKKGYVLKSEYVNEYVSIRIEMAERLYSEPKLYIPKENGKPSVAPGKRWYVYFYTRDPKTKKMNVGPHKFFKNLNRLKTVSERKAAGKAMANAYSLALSKNWLPQSVAGTVTVSAPRNKKTIKHAIDHVLKLKAAELAEPTMDDYKVRIGIFERWLDQKGLIGALATDITLDHIYAYLDFLRLDYKKENGEHLSNTSIDNYKRTLSAIFTGMKNERLIVTNFVKDIPKIKGKPTKNKPFTIQELMDIKETLKKKDPYLVPFLAFMIYPVLRPREVVRLKIKNLNTKDWVFSVQTKTKSISFSRIIKKMRPIISQMNIEGKPDHFSLFSPKLEPAVWETKKLSSKVMFFSRRFTKIIRKMGFSEEYTLYSVRHTAILILYNSLKNKGLSEQEIIYGLLPITKHSTEAGLRNYLRDMQAFLPPDHSDLYAIDF